MGCLCKYCGSSLYTIVAVYSEPEGLRADRYCPLCNVRYACHKSGLRIIFDGKKLKRELRSLKGTQAAQCPECARFRELAYDAEVSTWQALTHEARVQAARYAMRVHALEEENDRLKALCDNRGEALTHLIRDLDDLMSESYGVVGLHMNGDVALWDSLHGDGAFSEWLASFDKAAEAMKGEGA